MPPVIARVEPDSGAVVAAPPSEASIYFDEVINERTVGQPADLAGAVLLSPTTEPERVAWHRDHVTVRPKSGFVAGRVYHIELLPVITDLRNNRIRAGRTIVFSTGPAIPDAAVEGTVVDWVGGHAAVRALIEAVLMPDSLVYRALADSGGVFHIGQLPPGHYRIYGVMDSNHDKRRGAREIYDSASVDIDSAVAPLELYAFQRDTTGPRLRQVEVTDSLTLKLTFDRPLDPTLVLDTSMVTVAALDDSTTPLPLVGVFTQKGADSLRARTADSLAAAREAADSTRRAARDTTRAAADTTRPVVPDTTRRVAPDTTRRVRPDTTRRARPAPAPRNRADSLRAVLRPAAGDSSRGGPRAPLDSTRADRMLARRPPPTDVRVIKVGTPLIPDTRYVVKVRGARSLSGNPSDSARSQVRAPRPEVPRDRGIGGSGDRDSTTRDSTARDTIPRPPAPPIPRP